MATRYTLTLPTAASSRNGGYNVPELHSHIRECLAQSELFGGFTVQHGDGYWGGVQAGYEPVTIYIADTSAPHEDALELLQDLARWFGKRAGQEAVYITWSPISTHLVYI